MTWASVSKNWRTTVAGIAAFLLSVPAFITAIQAWGNHQPVDWRSVLVSVAISAAGAGLVSAKDGATHSTFNEVNKASVDAIKDVDSTPKAA